MVFPASCVDVEIYIDVVGDPRRSPTLAARVADAQARRKYFAGNSAAVVFKQAAAVQEHKAREHSACHAAMESLLELLVAANVRSDTRPDGTRIYSVHDFIREACNTTYTNANKKWKTLLDTKSRYRRALEANVFPMKLRTTATNVRYETPAMEIEGLQTLLFIFGTQAAHEFRKTIAGVSKLGAASAVREGDAVMLSDAETDAETESEYRATFRQKLAERLATGSTVPAAISCSPTLSSKHSISFVLCSEQ